MRSTTRSEATLTTEAKMPLVVSTASPFCSASMRCWSFLRSAFCGRMTMKYRMPNMSAIMTGKLRPPAKNWAMGELSTGAAPAACANASVTNMPLPFGW